MQQLAEWHVAEWSPLIQGFNVPAMIAEFATHDGGLKIPTTLVALEDDELIGSVSLLDNDHDDIRAYSPWLASLYVCPDQRGRGLDIDLERCCKLGWQDVATVHLRGVCATVMGIAPRALAAA